MALHETAAGFLNRRPVEISKAAAKRDELVVGKLLAAKPDHQVIQPGAVDNGEVLAGDALQVYVLNIRPESRARRDDLDFQATTVSKAQARIRVLC